MIFYKSTQVYTNLHNSPHVSIRYQWSLKLNFHEFPQIKVVSTPNSKLYKSLNSPHASLSPFENPFTQPTAIDWIFRPRAPYFGNISLRRLRHLWLSGTALNVPTHTLPAVLTFRIVKMMLSRLAILQYPYRHGPWPLVCIVNEAHATSIRAVQRSFRWQP